MFAHNGSGKGVACILKVVVVAHCASPPSRQYLSNDDCPDDKKEDYQNAGLCVTVGYSDTHTHMSSS